MSNFRMTPGLNVTGIYTVTPPFKLVDNKEYTCVAISGFTIIRDGVSLSKDLYVKYEIDDARYDSDKALGAMLVTLSSPGEDDVIIPDTFITQLPILNGIPYQHVLMSIDMGNLPTDLDLENSMAGIRETLRNSLGIETLPKVLVYEDAFVVEPAVDMVSTKGRLELKNSTDTLFGKVSKLETKIAKLEKEKAIYIKHIKSLNTK